MSNLNLRDVLAAVRSEKIKERTEGLSNLRIYFTSEKAIRNFDSNGDGRPWLVVYQALFTAVTTEKKTLFGKKSTAAAERRLSDVASIMRTITERSARRLNKKVVKALFTHFTQTIVHDGSLLSYLSLDYAKAIRTLLAWTPHLDHLDEAMWLSLVQLSINVVLDEHPRNQMDGEDGIAEEEGSVNEEEEVLSELGSPRKRRFTSSTPAPEAKPFRRVLSQPHRVVSQEQTEFMSILVLLFQSANAPLLSAEHAYLPNAIYARLLRFLRMYPSDSSLHHGFLGVLNALLSKLALNAKAATTKFATEAWDYILTMWHSKTKGNRESLLGVLLVLLPYYKSPRGEDYDFATINSGVGKLAAVFEEQLDSRKGVDSLDLDTLRLGRCRDTSHDATTLYSFRRSTFSVGSGFNSSHAITWVILTIHADCIAYLEDRGDSRANGKTGRLPKRAKLQSPIMLLLQSINDSSSSARIYRMQLLLFLIDGHWTTLDQKMQRGIITSLLQSLSFEENVTQSFAFLCFAAAAESTTEISNPSAALVDSSIWDQVWTGALRKMSNAAVCRSACHCATILLKQAKCLLSSSRIIHEVEMLMSDLDVHGPPGLEDSISDFFVELLVYAHQDVRLYHMKIEDKLLAWLPDVWRNPTDARARGRTRHLGPLNHVPSSLNLIEGICGLQHRAGLLEIAVLPDGAVVDTLLQNDNTALIRDFLLHARLPDLSRGHGLVNDRQSPLVIGTTSFMIASSGRERRASAILLKVIETASDELEEHRGSNGQMPAEDARCYLDLAVVSMAFCSSLARNGIKPNRRILQLACKLVTRIVSSLPSSSWTVDEKAYVMHGMAPLVLDEEDDQLPSWEPMVKPGFGTGIKREALVQLLPRHGKGTAASDGHQGEWRNVLWQDADVQSGFSAIVSGLKDILRSQLGQTPTLSGIVEDRDLEFAMPSVTSHTQQDQSAGSLVDSRWRRDYMRVVLGLLTVAPTLQSKTPEPIRDTELSEIFATCDDDLFLNQADLYFQTIRHQMLGLGSPQLGQLLLRFETLLTQYAHARSERLQVLVVRFLDATMPLWLQPTVALAEAGSQTRDLCHWLASMLNGQKIRSWVIRDLICTFFDRYLACDPYHQFWAPATSSQDREDEVPQDLYPCIILPKLGGDEDIRVRFRVASVNSRILVTAKVMGQEPIQWYDGVRQWLSEELESFEHMVTRFLCLGNIMVASSSVRRAPYWHLLETDLHSTQYSAHLASVLDCVSRRMGLSQYAQLFEAYASQIGYSLVEGNYESLRLSPALLGFSSLKTYAEASFGSFAPAYLSTNDQSTELTNHARSLFLNHCQAIHSSPQEGIMSCFGDVVGLSAVAWVDQHMNDEDPSDGLEEFLARMLAGYNVEGSLADQLAQTVDKIITAILRTLGETDFLPEGAIVQDIRAVSPRNLEAVRTFQSLVLYRRLQDFDIHQPNLPLYGTRTIMQALDWAQRCTKVDTFSLTYHVLHQLFVDILETSLVNEQLRLVNALSIWIACHSVHIRDSTLLRVLLNGATSMMTQFDLVTSAQSLLSWSLEIYRGLDDQIQTMPSILLFISSTVRDYCSAEDDDVKARGQALAKWLHSELSALVEIDHHREQVIKKVLPAWSLELPTNLAELNDELTTFDVSEILEDCRITSNKFRLVNKMRDLAHFETSTAGNSFAKADFWRLKKCIPEASQLQVQDIYAFAELLTLHHGHIVSFDGTGLTSEGVRHRHRGQLLEKAPMTVESLTQKPVVSTVRSLLDRPGGGSLRKVYETLQRVLGTLSHHELEFRSWPSELRAELRYLAAFRRPFTKPSSDHLRDLTEKDLFVTSLDDFDTWITAFTDLLCGVIGSTKALFQALGPYVRDDPSFAEDILPVLVHTILFLQVQSPGEEDARSILSDYLATVARSDIACQNTLRAVVDIVLHLRSFVIPGSTSPLSYNEWLRIDFALFSRMAIKCGAFTTALLFLELRPEHNKDQGEATAVEDIYYEIYSHIEEPDGFYSIESKDVQQFLLRRFQHEDEWEKAFQFYGASIEAAPNEPTPEHGMISSLHSYGFNRLAMSTLAARGTSNNTESRHPRLNFDLGWRTETWDLPDIQNDSDMSSTLYSALRAVHRETSREAIDATLQGALRSELERLRLLGTENMADVRQVVQSMLCLRQVAQWQSARHEPGTSVIPWMTRDGLESDRQLDFSQYEAVMATRMTLLRSARHQLQRDQIGNIMSPAAQCLLDAERDSLLCVAEAAREFHQLQLALNAVTRARALETPPSVAVMQEFSCVLWSLNEQKLAIQSLKQLVSAQEDTQMEPSVQRSLMLSRLGEWTTEACVEKPLDILNNYFSPAATQLPSLESTQTLSQHARVYYQFAVFAEKQYQDILKSPDTIRYKLYMDRKMKELSKRKEAVRAAQQGTQAHQSAMGQYKKTDSVLREDRDRYDQHTRTLGSFREQAIDMFSRTLAVSDQFDHDSIMRLISLWFANFDDNGIYPRVGESIDRVASRKFVFLAHQLSARLSANDASLPPTQATPTQHINATSTRNGQNVLRSLILRMCREHPFHSLYQVYCLKPANEPGASQGRRQSGRVEVSSQLDREAAALDIFAALKQDGENVDRVLAVEELCNASLQWAQHPIKKEHSDKRKKAPFTIPDSLLIRRLRDIRVPVTTAYTPLDPTLKYDDCVWVARYEPTYATAGGVNLPKISVCLGSDGVSYKQLFKGEGNDDMRQDAVMEQVFEVVNRILDQDKQTKKRNLRVRTYKVIPLAPQAGLLEFVSNTTPLQTWVFPAHSKYNPRDIPYPEVDAELRRKQKAHVGPEVMLATFLSIRTRFKPVMRHFFTEQHRTPSAWFAMRLAYTRSVATTSIVGHILGLGDRHSSNILLDNTTGEVVHIDLGIAFDQGKALPIPERVPFRMTADIVDGMGVSGTQGVFQRCAEETLRVLRSGSDIIMTVLEVFRHDPLQTWTVKDEKVKRVQGGGTAAGGGGVGTIKAILGIDINSDVVAEAADRALSTVSRKLAPNLSVEYTVNELIAEATDPLHLANMFVGWGPQY